MGLPRPWEPEESIGTLWHRLVGDRPPPVMAATVSLASMRPRMGIVLRGLGGGHGLEIKAATAEPTRHRRGFKARIGHAGERQVTAVCDGETLEVPAALAEFAAADDNRLAFLLIAALAALDDSPAAIPADPLAVDLGHIRRMRRAIDRLGDEAPGLVAPFLRLSREVLTRRPGGGLPEAEAAVEALVRELLGAPEALPASAQALLALDTPTAPAGYRPMRPVILFPRRRDLSRRDGRAAEAAAATGAPAESTGGRKKARRHAGDQANRRDSFILNRFETIKTWAEALNLNRKVDDESDEAAKAADDQDELGLAPNDASPATRLAFDLDLSPQDVALERLAAGRRLPEWDYRRGTFLSDHVRILDTPALAGDPPNLAPDRRRRIAAVRRQFEALRPRRLLSPSEDEGDDIETEAVVRLVADRAAGRSGPVRLFRRLEDGLRDLSVATLLDASRSTETVVEERPVIAVAREALLALGHGLQASGDAHGIYAFSSLRRDRVFMSRLKAFDEPMSAEVEGRIGAVRPGFYTRLGAAIRHVADDLARRPSQRRLLLVLTDGKPNDLDHYEGRHGIEDTRHAVAEARQRGLAVFAITIDRKAETYVPHLFGRNGYAIVSHPARLAEALPAIYRHLMG